MEVGKVYEGPIIRIMDFGAVIQLLPGVTACCTSARSPTSASTPSPTSSREGDLVKVKVLGFDDKGRVKLSRKVLLDEQAAADNADATGNAPQQ